MKNLIHQFYNEGLGSLFCKRPINHIKSKTNNKVIINIFSFIIMFIYTILILVIAGYIFYKKLPI